MSPSPRFSRRALTMAALLGGAALTTGVATRPATAASTRHIELTRWASTAQLATGSQSGTRAVTPSGSDGALTWAKATGTRSYTSRGTTKSYETATWTSPRIKTSFGLTELILSWNAVTPSGSFVEFQVQGRTSGGKTSKWYSMGRWAHWDSASRIHRTSVTRQADAYADVYTDTLATKGSTRFTDYAVRVILHRVKGSSAQPSVRTLTALATRLPSDATVPTSAPGVAAGLTLAVPTYSQMTHEGHYPQYNGGGEAWCSPTSTAMVLDYLQLGPSGSSMNWIPATHRDRQVDHAARMTYDYAYDGTGNWAFNAAYANHEGAEAFLTRFRSLRDAEPLLKAGIPLVVSTSFKSGQLSGAGYGTNGHLMVIVGITRSGDVVVNDPASHLRASNAQVRTVYRRGQFENAWIPKSGGLAYVIAPPGKALPKPTHAKNW